MVTKSRRGYAMFELLLGLIISGILLSVIVKVGVTYYSNRAPAYIDNLPVAIEGQLTTAEANPSLQGMMAATALNTQLSELLDTAQIVYVFGGKGQDPQDATQGISQITAPLPPSLPEVLIGQVMLHTPSRMLDPRHAYATLANRFNFTASNDPVYGSYTVMTLDGQSRITGILTVRGNTVTQDGKAYVAWVAALRTPATFTSYAMLLPSATANLADYPQALTVWRGNPDAEAFANTARFAAPVYRIMLPDPTVEPGQHANPRPSFLHVFSASK